MGTISHSFVNMQFMTFEEYVVLSMTEAQDSEGLRFKIWQSALLVQPHVRIYLGRESTLLLLLYYLLRQEDNVTSPLQFTSSIFIYLCSLGLVKHISGATLVCWAQIGIMTYTSPTIRKELRPKVIPTCTQFWLVVQPSSAHFLTLYLQYFSRQRGGVHEISRYGPYSPNRWRVMWCQNSPFISFDHHMLLFYYNINDPYDGRSWAASPALPTLSPTKCFVGARASELRLSLLLQLWFCYGLNGFMRLETEMISNDGLKEALFVLHGIGSRCKCDFKFTIWFVMNLAEPAADVWKIQQFTGLWQTESPEMQAINATYWIHVECSCETEWQCGACLIRFCNCHIQFHLNTEEMCCWIIWCCTLLFNGDYSN